jgi:CRISP-associated protein Cas1
MIEKRLRNLIVCGFGYKIKPKRCLLCISSDEGNSFFSPKELDQLIIAGEALISSAAVRLLVSHGVAIVFVKQHPRFFARIIRCDDVNFFSVWKKQMMLSSESKLLISKEIFTSMLNNKKRMLQQFSRNRAVDVSREIELLSLREKDIESAKNIFEVMGYEGFISRTYYSGLRRLIPNPFVFRKRLKHPPPDPVNVLLSYGYTILCSKVISALEYEKLNIYEGVLHESYRNRAALAFDLMEEFRQPIVDRVVVTLLVRKMVDLTDFIISEGVCRMNQKTKTTFLDLLFRRFNESYFYEGKTYEFQDIITIQARRLAYAICSDGAYRGFRYR